MRNKKLWLKDQFDKHSSKLYGVAIRYFEQGNASNFVERTFLEAFKREMLIEEDCFLFLRGILLEKIIEEIPRVKFDCKIDDSARDNFDLIDNLTVDTNTLVRNIRTLSINKRLIFNFLVIDGFSTDQVSRIFGVERSVVESECYRAKKEILEKL